MAKKACLILAVVLLLFGTAETAFAVNWMYVQRMEGTRLGPCHEFIDADSVVQSGDQLIYWSLWRMEEPSGPQRVVKVLRKKEARLNEPRQSRILEYYYYGADDEEIRSYQKPGMFSSFDASSRRALHYVGSASNPTADRPTELDVSLPRWTSSGSEHEEFELFIDIRSIRALPRQEKEGVPAEFEMTVKKVWNPAGAAVRIAELNKNRPAKHGYRNLAYSTATYRFHLGRNRSMLLMNSDHDTHGVTLEFSFETDWRDLATGSLEAELRTIGVRWFRGEWEG